MPRRSRILPEPFTETELLALMAVVETEIWNSRRLPEKRRVLCRAYAKLRNARSVGPAPVLAVLEDGHLREPTLEEANAQRRSRSP